MLQRGRLTGKARMGLLALCEYNACLLADEHVAIVSANTCRYLPLVKKVIPCGVNMERFSPRPRSRKRRPCCSSARCTGASAGRCCWTCSSARSARASRTPSSGRCARSRSRATASAGSGASPEETLTDLYRRAWVFCLPSTYEGFGVPYIEAMASGTPVVATPNVGAREVTQEGRAGLLVRDADLAETLVQVLTDADLRQRLREAGLQRAQDFSWDRVCAQYEAIYAGPP